MSKRKYFLKQFFLSIASIVSFYFGMVSLQIIPINPFGAVLVSLTIAFIFLLGMLIIAPSLDKDAEQFAIKFLLLTTVQLLLSFLIIGTVVFMRLEEFRRIGFHMVSLFVLLLGIQSFLLIRISNRTI
jgi:hypothetical protein